MKNNYTLLLVFSVFLVFVSVFGGVAGKGAAVAFGMWLVHKRKVEYFPLIVLSTAFLSTAYILYLQMFLLTLSNYKIVKPYKQTTLFYLFVMMMGAFIIYSMIKFIVTDNNLGKSLESYSFVLAMAPFFYAFILKGDVDFKLFFKRLFSVLVFILLLNVILKELSPKFTSTRLVFYIVPFLFVLIILNLREKNISHLFFSILALVFAGHGVTFTLLFTALLSVLYLYTSKFLTLKKLLPILFFFIPVTAIINFENIDYSQYSDLKMEEINSYDDFKNRLGMKLYEDRAPIWLAAWQNIVNNPQFQPPLNPPSYLIEGRSNKETEWEYHSHNLFLESILKLGQILGLLVSVVFLVINIKAFNNLNFTENRFIESFFITAIISNLIASQSGVFPLLLDYAFFSMGLIGLLVVFKNKKPLMKFNIL